MADGATNKMVLRTLYIPLELDRVLRSLAFSRSVSKAELMRDFIEEGLRKVAASGERTLAERLSAQAAETAVERNEEAAEKATPAQIKKSITPDALISFIDGKPYKMLKRHLSTHGLDFETYRARYGLPDNYPAVAASYSAARSDLAKAIGLGRDRRSQTKETTKKTGKTKAQRTQGHVQAAG